jgi:hypothetical protein
VRRAPAAVFAAFFVMGMLRAAPSLQWPMVYDDLHLIRPYTTAEIAASWRGNWDPDDIETPGFRPGTLLFNHARARLFGESVVAHRIFLIALYAAFVALLVPLAARFGAGPRTVLLAGAMMLAARYQVYGYVWLTDGTHMLQGLAFAGGALLLLDGLDRDDRVRLGLSLACLAAGLLVREDTLAIVPVILLLGVVDSRRQGRAVPRALHGYAGALVMLCAGLLVYRAIAVPQAPVPGSDIRGLAIAVARVLNPIGIQAFDRSAFVLGLVGWLVLAGFVDALVRWRRDADWRGAALWLAAAVVSCSPALNIQRDDLLFFPGTFMALFYASAAETLARRKGATRAFAVVGITVLIAVAGSIGIVFAENFHPDSSRTLWWNAQFLDGEFAARATIPEARRRAMIESLERRGIRAGARPRQRIRELAAEAKAAGRRRPSADHKVFVPLLLEGF